MLEIYSTSWGSGTYKEKIVSYSYGDLRKQGAKEKVICRIMAFTNDGLSFKTVIHLIDDTQNIEDIVQEINFIEIKETIINEVIYSKKNCMGDLTPWFEQINWIVC